MSEDKSPGQEIPTDGVDDQSTPQTVDELIAALETARSVAEQARDQALRAQAEIENIRRRSQRDVENAHKFALERFGNDLLPVVDSLERAVDSARSTERHGAVAAIADGVELSLKLFVDTLARSNLIQVDPVGEPFDPKAHQAVSMVESDTAEPGSVLQVLQKGYTLNGRLVRPAMVIVAKSPAGSAN
jgi:molecular chaperone GrpE